MTRDPVVSSNLMSVGYDETARRLEVAFRPDRTGYAAVWEYDDVDLVTFEGLVAAESIGRAFTTLRRNYNGRRVATITPDGVEQREEVASHE